jgi:hypothetical protein
MAMKGIMDKIQYKVVEEVQAYLRDSWECENIEGDYEILRKRERSYMTGSAAFQAVDGGICIPPKPLFSVPQAMALIPNKFMEHDLPGDDRSFHTLLDEDGYPMPKGYALVTKNLDRKDAIFYSQRAETAKEAELEQLQTKKVFDLNLVMEEKDAKAQFPDAQFVSFDMIVGIKHWELQEKHHKFKARGVAGGHDVRDARGVKVVNNETLYVLPVGISGTRVVISYAYATGGTVLSADVDGAYLHAPLGGAKVFLKVPRSLRRKSAKWDKINSPVVMLFKSLYGLKRSNYDWDAYAKAVFLRHGWVEIYDSEGTLYKCGKHLMSLYVDDLLIAGPNVAWMRAKIKDMKDEIQLKEDPQLLTSHLAMHFSVLQLNSGHLQVRISQHNYTLHILQEFKKIAGYADNHKFKHVLTPAYDDDYRELDDLESESGIYGGQIASKIIGMVFFLARCVRADVLQANTALASQVSVWTKASDARLLRLLAYLESTYTVSIYLEFFPGKIEDLELWIYTDSDHGGDRRTARSTSGWVLFLVNQKTGTKALLDFGCRRQSRPAFNTSEAELIALQDGTLRCALPICNTYEQIFGIDAMRTRTKVDCDPARLAVIKGVSIALRYIRKYQFVSLAGLHAIFSMDEQFLEREDSATNDADMFTKPLGKILFVRNRKSIGLR